MALCPEMFLRNVPSGHFHTLMLSDEADANVYSLGWNAIALTDFLWLVSVDMHLPMEISHNLIIESWEPLMIYGSNS